MQLYDSPPDFQLRDASENTVALQTFLKRERLIIALQPQSEAVEVWRDNAELSAQLDDFDLRVLCLFDQLPDFQLNLRRVHLLHDSNGETANCYEVNARDVWILVGNDGTIKHIWRGDFAVESAFALINQMPMRQRELKARGEN